MMMTVCLSVCLFVCLSWIQDEHYWDWGWLGGGCIMMMTVCRRSLALGNSQSDPSMSVGSAGGQIPHHYISISVSTTSLRISYFNICINYYSHNIILHFNISLRIHTNIDICIHNIFQFMYRPLH